MLDFLLRLRIVAIFTVLARQSVGRQSSPANRPWPPGVQTVSNESPPLSPDDALKTFYMPPGYHLELVASEPLIQEPVAIDWDLEGRLWVVEMPGFMADLTGSNEHDPIGRVVVLEDTNGDGADGQAHGLRRRPRARAIGEDPRPRRARRRAAQPLADARHQRGPARRHEGAGLEPVRPSRGDPQKKANGFPWALDNRLYTAGETDLQLRLKNGAFELQKTLQRGEWGVTEDDAGRIYRNTNESALHVDLVQTAYFARNPHLLRTRGSYERLADDNPELNTVWPVRPNPGTNRAYQIGIDRPDGSLAKFTSVCAPLVYRGDRLPADLYGNVFVAEPAANVVSRIVLDDSGETLRARKAYERGEFLASTDERFRPVYLSNAPDGTLYVADMYRGIIEHRISTTIYLRDQILVAEARSPDRDGPDLSRRARHDAARHIRGRLNASTADLVALLSHPNGWRRETASG